MTLMCHGIFYMVKIRNIPKERFDTILGDFSIKSELLIYKKESNEPMAIHLMQCNSRDKVVRLRRENRTWDHPGMV